MKINSHVFFDNKCEIVEKTTCLITKTIHISKGALSGAHCKIRQKPLLECVNQLNEFGKYSCVPSQ